MPMTGVLRRVERQLRRLYAIEGDPCVADFLVNEQKPPFAGEQTIIVAEDGDVSVGVYIDPRLLDLLAAHDPWVSLDSTNLHPFCRVLEEVSHVLYLLWNANYDKQVTALEMELQADVDKFVLSAFYLSAQNEGRVPRELMRELLFGRELAPELGSDLLDRYGTARRLAARYCSYIQRRFFRPERTDGLVAELRRFYRKSQCGKIDHIHGAAEMS